SLWRSHRAASPVLSATGYCRDPADNSAHFWPKLARGRGWLFQASAVSSVARCNKQSKTGTEHTDHILHAPMGNRSRPAAPDRCSTTCPVSPLFKLKADGSQITAAFKRFRVDAHGPHLSR